MLKDVQYGVRMLLKNPGLTLVAVITLALGIGANTAIFSAVGAFMLRPLPVPNGNELVCPTEITEDRGLADEFSYPDYLDYRAQSTSFAGLAAESMIPAAIDSDSVTSVSWGQAVSANYFDVVQVQPILGRTFNADEDKNVGVNPVLVLSHSFWQRRFGGDPNIVGKTVRVNDRPYQVIGVAPEAFVGTKFALAMDIWTPMSMVEELNRSPKLLTTRSSHWMNPIGRLKPGVSLSQASAEMTSIANRLNETYPDARSKGTQVRVVPETEARFGEVSGVVRNGSAIALAIVGLILLIACANVA